jgi:hypothetical protein
MQAFNMMLNDANRGFLHSLFYVEGAGYFRVYCCKKPFALNDQFLNDCQMKNVCVLMLLLMATTSFAQKKITLEDVRKHIHESVEVTGKVAEVVFLQKEKNSPTVINVGGKAPNQLLSIVILGDVRKKLGYNPQEEKYVQGAVIARGKLELFKGSPRIVIKDPAQLSFIYDEEVPLSEIPPIEKNN